MGSRSSAGAAGRVRRTPRRSRRRSRGPAARSGAAPSVVVTAADSSRRGAARRRRRALGAALAVGRARRHRRDGAAPVVQRGRSWSPPPQTLRDAGATAIDVADSPMAKMRMSAWAACRLVQEQVGHRDRAAFPDARTQHPAAPGRSAGRVRARHPQRVRLRGRPGDDRRLPARLERRRRDRDRSAPADHRAFQRGRRPRGLLDRRADVVLRRRCGRSRRARSRAGGAAARQEGRGGGSASC